MEKLYIEPYVIKVLKYMLNNGKYIHINERDERSTN